MTTHFPIILIILHAPLTWTQGRRLASFGSVASYTYGEDGIRLTKKVGSNTHHYYYSGGQLLMEEVVNASGILQYAFVFIYDEAGSPVGFGYTTNVTSWQWFAYEKTIQGDIIGIVNSSGTRIGGYTYNAWGKVLTETNNTIVQRNPLRYRGYYYDRETHLYYLQSRYYDASVGRFISPDSLLGGRAGLNRYAYCLNNPVRYIDPSGYITICGICGTVTLFSRCPTPQACEEAGRARFESEPSDEEKYGPTQIFLGVHGVVGSPIGHASVVVFAYPESEFWDHDEFQYNYDEKRGAKYMTIGGGDCFILWANMQGNFNRKSDANLSNKSRLIRLHSTANVNDTVNMLIQFQNNYQNNATYALFPVTKYNSNSYAHGILNAAGLYPNKPWPWLPGWHRPLPISYFGH